MFDHPHMQQAQSHNPRAPPAWWLLTLFAKAAPAALIAAMLIGRLPCRRGLHGLRA